MYINSEGSYVFGVINALISDLDGVFCSIPQNKPVTNTLKRIKFRDHSNNSLNAFESMVAEGMISFHLYVVDGKIKMLFNVLLNAYNSTCKIREKIISTKKLTAPGMTQSPLNCTLEKKNFIDSLLTHHPCLKLDY